MTFVLAYLGCFAALVTRSVMISTARQLDAWRSRRMRARLLEQTPATPDGHRFHEGRCLRCFWSRDVWAGIRMAGGDPPRCAPSVVAGGDDA